MMPHCCTPNVDKAYKIFINSVLYNKVAIPHLPLKIGWVAFPIFLICSDLNCNCLIFSKSRDKRPMLYHNISSYIIIGICCTLCCTPDEKCCTPKIKAL